jgi:hypothetical protein
VWVCSGSSSSRQPITTYPSHHHRVAACCHSSFRRRTSDFFVLLLFGAVFLIAVTILFDPPIHFLGSSLTFMLVYVWSKRNREVQMRFLQMLNFTAPYLPWCAAAVPDAPRPALVAVEAVPARLGLSSAVSAHHAQLTRTPRPGCCWRSRCCCTTTQSST